MKSLGYLDFLRSKNLHFVCINLTNRCEYHCRYCSIANRHEDEMNFEEIRLLIDQISQMEVKAVSLTGGNPLLRQDICEIIDYLRFKKIKIYLSSGGSLMVEKLSAIKKVDFLQISFDGPEQINDLQRYKGAYQHFIQAVKLARAEKIGFYTLTVLTRNNLSAIDHILDFAKKNKVFAYFQPVGKTFFLENNTPELILDKQEYKIAIHKLMRLKRSNRYVGNTLASLQFMYQGDKSYKCFGGKRFAYIHSNGDIYPCWTPPNMRVRNWRKEGFGSAFINMPIFDCNNCYCISHVELNLACALNFLKIYEEGIRKIVSLLHFR